jgi:hypothetical protein
MAGFDSQNLIKPSWLNFPGKHLWPGNMPEQAKWSQNHQNQCKWLVLVKKELINPRKALFSFKKTKYWSRNILIGGKPFWLNVCKSNFKILIQKYSDNRKDLISKTPVLVRVQKLTRQRRELRETGRMRLYKHVLCVLGKCDCWRG